MDLAGSNLQVVDLVIVHLPYAEKGFVLPPQRWIAERSLVWTTRSRRLVRDYERYASTLAGLHLAAFVCLTLKQVVALINGS